MNIDTQAINATFSRAYAETGGGVAGQGDCRETVRYLEQAGDWLGQLRQAVQGDGGGQGQALAECLDTLGRTLTGLKGGLDGNPPPKEVLDGLNLEALAMVVQVTRANVLQEVMKGQIIAVRQKNEDLEKFRAMRAYVSNALAGDGWLNQDTPEKKQVYRELQQAGLLAGYRSNDSTDDACHFSKDSLQGIKDNIAKAIDEASSDQQMMMTRLQSLQGKCNESVDVIATTVRKISEQASHIIGHFA